MLQETYSEEVLKIIKNIGNDCSTRFKNIQISLIKPAAECTASPLAHIINTQLSKQTFVKKWKMSHKKMTKLKDLSALSKVYSEAATRGNL